MRLVENDNGNTILFILYWCIIFRKAHNNNVLIISENDITKMIAKERHLDKRKELMTRKKQIHETLLEILPGKCIFMKCFHLQKSI